MIQEVRTYSLLTGIQGEEAVDIDAIVNALLRLNQLVMDFPQIHELDINLLIVKTKGAVALDARITIHGG
jgi:acetyltransferase